MIDFRGFGPKTTKFLRDLGRHNEKAWFDAHRDEYEQHEGSAGKLSKTPHRRGRGKVSRVWASVERKSPPELASAKFVSYCVREWKKLAPLHRWLMDNVA